jgi:hypothetical protein
VFWVCDPIPGVTNQKRIVNDTLPFSCPGCRNGKRGEGGMNSNVGEPLLYILHVKQVSKCVAEVNLSHCWYVFVPVLYFRRTETALYGV